MILDLDCIIIGLLNTNNTGNMSNIWNLTSLAKILKFVSLYSLLFLCTKMKVVAHTESNLFSEILS